MTAAELVRTRLLVVSAVTAIVSSRIYVFALPPNYTAASGPAVRVQRISETEVTHMRGTSGMRMARVQVDAVASTLATAYALDEAIHGPGDGTALAGFEGDVGGQSVVAALPDAVRELFDPEETQLYRVMRDYFVTYRE